MKTSPDRTPKAERIRSVPLFAKADRVALDHLVRGTDEVTVEAGRVLITQGHIHNEALVVESGTAEVVLDGEVVAEIPSGELIGELSFFDRGPATATVRAKTKMDLLVIPHNRFDQIIDDNPQMLKEMARELAARLRSMDARHH